MHDKVLDKHRLRDTLHSNWPVLVKNVKVKIYTQKNERLDLLVETRLKRHNKKNAMSDLQLNPGLYPSPPKK